MKKRKLTLKTDTIRNLTGVAGAELPMHTNAAALCAATVDTFCCGPEIMGATQAGNPGTASFATCESNCHCPFSTKPICD